MSPIQRLSKQRLELSIGTRYLICEHHRTLVEKVKSGQWDTCEEPENCDIKGCKRIPVWEFYIKQS